MAEFEELRLTVTLIDHASQGLVNLRQNVRAFGGSENRESLTRMQQETEKLGEKLIKVREHMSNTEKAAERLGQTIGATIRTFAVAFVANFAIDSLKKFTDEMVRLDAAARQFGVGGGQLKGLVEQMKIMGIGGAQATQAVTGFANALAELGREGGQMRHRLMQGAISDPEAMQAFIQRVTGLGKTGEIEKALNEFLDAADNVFQNELKRTGSTAMAAQRRNEWLEKFQLDAATLAMIKGRFREVTDAEKAEYARRNEITQNFSKAWNEMDKKYTDFVQGLQTGLLPLLLRINSAMGTMGEDWGKTFGEGFAMGLGNIMDTVRQLYNFATSPIETTKGVIKDAANADWALKLHPNLQKKLGMTPSEESKRFWEAQRKQGHHTIWDDADTDGTTTPPASKMSYRPGDSQMPAAIKASLGGEPINVGGGGGYSRSGTQSELARAIRAGVFGAFVDFRDSMKTGGAGGGGGGGGGMPGFTRASLTTGNTSSGDRTSPSGPSSPSGPNGRDTTNPAPNVGGGDQPVPGSIMEKARAIAQLGPAAVSEFMAKQGYPKHDAWCGDFAAATVRAAGGTPPKGWSTASNWRNVGPEVAAENAQPGDIAVRRPEFHGRLGTGRTGDTGSHVTILDQMLKDRRFSGIGGNQGRIVSNFDVNKYQFYRPHVDPDKATAGRKLDGSLGNEVKSRGEATGKLSADVTAPPGTKVEVNGKGVFSKTETTRRTPINSEAPAVSI